MIYIAALSIVCAGVEAKRDEGGHIIDFHTPLSPIRWMLQVFPKLPLGKARFNGAYVLCASWVITSDIAETHRNNSATWRFDFHSVRVVAPGAQPR
jgi:hypothetical protein